VTISSERLTDDGRAGRWSLGVGGPAVPGLAAVLAQIAAHADRLDREPRFPTDAFHALAGAGGLPSRVDRRTFVEQLRLVERVAHADGSVSRILDGHLNAVERLDLDASGQLRDDERRAIGRGEMILGVWGADPARGEGPPARLHGRAGALKISGVKTFCSGAGGLARALVIARDDEGARRLAYVDLSRGVTIDRSWYRAAGLRASESHRVVFDGAPVRAVLGGADELLREPWFSRDAIRTTATWAGIARSVVDAATDRLGRRSQCEDLIAVAVGRMRVALTTIDLWLQHAGGQADVGADVAGVAIELRWAVAAAARGIAADAALACGAHPLATGGALSRGRRDLDLFLQQHRLEPMLARHGAASLHGHADPA
jgi:hypothetical protein